MHHTYNSELKRCKKCLLPETYPAVGFDEEGVCSYCRNHSKRELFGEERFLDLIGSARGRDYDCLVGISGGKDSCYVAYLAKKTYGFRVLAVCYDFPFLVDLARANIRSVCDTLGIDLVTVTSKGNLEYRLLQNHFKSVAATGTSWGQCIFCHYGIEAILHREALERGIPFILGGITKYELWNLCSRAKLLLRRVKKLPLPDQMNFVHYQLKAYSLLVEQRRQFRIPGNNLFDVYRRANSPLNGPQGINVFDYLPWEQNAIEETLIRETGWVRPERSVSWRYDCVLEPFLDYTYKKEFGISTVGLYLSHMIRDGLMNRADALETLLRMEHNDFIRDKLKPVLDYLRLPESLQEKFFKTL